MAKKSNGKIKKGDSEKVKKAISNVESKILDNYKSVVSSSGKSWAKESKKMKVRLAAAKKKIEASIRKNPAHATAAAAILGAIAGAVIVHKLKKKNGG